MDKEKLKEYIALLPSRITVTTTRTDQGLYAKVEELPHCYTQADTLVELIEMLNDAMFCYLDIPEEYHSALGFYVPAKFIEEVRASRWQDAISEMLRDEFVQSPSVYNRVEVQA